MSKINEPKPKARVPQTNAHGIDLAYEDALGNLHETSEKTVAAILEAMGSEADGSEQGKTSGPIIVRQGEEYRLDSPGVIEFESGTSSPVSGSLPRDLPFGYHRLRTDANES